MLGVELCFVVVLFGRAVLTMMSVMLVTLLGIVSSIWRQGRTIRL